MSMFEQLAAEFPRNAVSWRAQSMTKDGDRAMALAYIDARDVMDRLDEVCGPAGWSDSYVETAKGRVICSIAIKTDEGWISKSDGAGDTAVEGDKGGISDAFKRAAVKFGIGAYLYALPKTYAETKKNPKTGKVSGFSNAGVRQLRAAYSAWLASNQPFGDALDHGFAVANHDDDPEDSPAAPGTTGAAASASDSAPAAGEHHHQGQTTSEAITTAYRNLEKEVGEDNARAAYALALHAAGVQPGDTPTYEQAQMIIGNLELALPAKVTA